jgi:hypothetical protein
MLESANRITALAKLVAEPPVLIDGSTDTGQLRYDCARRESAARRLRLSERP